jgi:hypothetical protein
MTLIYAYQNRGITRNIVINDANGNAITPGVNDLVRATIGRDGETAKFSVTSGTPSAAGSSITAGATNVMRLDATDLGTIDPGTYTLQLDYFDMADAQEWKMIERQTMVLEGVI